VCSYLNKWLNNERLTSFVIRFNLISSKTGKIESSKQWATRQVRLTKPWWPPKSFECGVLKTHRGASWLVWILLDPVRRWKVRSKGDCLLLVLWKRCGMLHELTPSLLLFNQETSGMILAIREREKRQANAFGSVRKLDRRQVNVFESVSWASINVLLWCSVVDSPQTLARRPSFLLIL